MSSNAITKYVCPFLVVLLTNTISSKADQHDTSQYDQLFAAADRGDISTISQAIALSSDVVKSRSWDNGTLLHEAIKYNHIDLATLLINLNADVNAQTSEGVTPLHIAAQSGYLDLITLLLDHGADPKIKDAQGRTALARAQQWGANDAVAFLEKNGVEN